MRCLLLLALALPAMACLNDTEVVRQEAEFRSGYPDAPVPPATAPPPAENPYRLIYAFAAGVSLTAFVGAIILRRRMA